MESSVKDDVEKQLENIIVPENTAQCDSQVVPDNIPESTPDFSIPVLENATDDIAELDLKTDTSAKCQYKDVPEIKENIDTNSDNLDDKSTTLMLENGSFLHSCEVNGADVEKDLLAFTASITKKHSLVSISSDEFEFLGEKKRKKLSLIDADAMQISSDFLTRRIKEGKDNEEYMKTRLDDKERELQDAEMKIKDLKLRLIRFAKDDQAKDKHVASLERELKELNCRFEEIMNQDLSMKKNDIPLDAPSKSKTCVLL